MKERYFGIEVGGTKLQVVTGEDPAKIDERLRYTIFKDQGAEGIKKHLEEALNSLTEQGKPLAVGIGFGGPVNRITYKISRSFHINGWADFDLAEWVHAKIKVPVFIENDGNVAALGEAIHGAGKNFDSVFYITLGSGVGGGLIQNGKIFHGAVPGEAEIGHIRLDQSGKTMESSCSGWSVDMKVREVIAREPEGNLAELARGAVSGEAKFLLPAMEQGDDDALHILQETGGDIAFGLSHVVHLFHPEIIVLGGGLSLIGEPLRSVVNAKIPPHIMDAFLPGPRILLSQLKEDAVPVGALELAKRNFLFESN
ncbi:MAG: ROK family protein [Bacteroidota bacterium]|nr:ROK family protein [Bacteroidota bacterium]